MIRGGGDPNTAMALKPCPEWAPLPRSLTAEANGCFMVRVLHGPNRIQGCGASIAPERGLPSDQLYQTSNNEGHRVAVTLDTKVLIQADMLVQEILSRNLRDRRAVARYAGLTGSPDESGVKRREKGLAKAGNARVRRGLIQLAWRFLRFQKESALGQWYRARTEGAAGKRKTTMIVALARKLLIALWRMVTTGEIPAGVALRTAAA